MHRGYKIFLVLLIEYQNLIVYIKQRMDWFLYKFRQFIRAYIEDVIVRLKSFNEYIYYLCQIFQLLVDYNISIKLSKTFLVYKNIDLLGQQADMVGLVFSKSKLKAITKI